MNNGIENFDLLLQTWGGIGYLLAKILLAFAEGAPNGRKLRIIAWSSYLAGIPAWVILLISKHNWIIAAIDLGSIPSMILGIVIAYHQNKINKAVDIFVRVFTYFMIVLGCSYSIYFFHGITTFSQVLEIIITFGFLLGSYLLAKQNPNGWPLFGLMSICMATLMFMQDKIILFFLQSFSLAVITFGYIRAIRKNKKTPS